MTDDLLAEILKVEDKFSVVNAPIVASGTVKVLVLVKHGLSLVPSLPPPSHGLSQPARGKTATLCRRCVTTCSTKP